MFRLPCALSIAGSDPGGGAGIQADLKTFAALGVHGLSVVTSLTVQNTRGVRGILDIPPEFVGLQLKTLLSDFEVKSAKTGMLSNASIIRVVRKVIGKAKLKLVVDPVMTSSTGHRLLQENAIDELKRLIGKAEVVVPNIREAEALSGLRIRGIAGMRAAATRIKRELGPKAVLVKGGHLQGRDAVDIMLSGGRFIEFKLVKLRGRLHGAGCTFSAAITAELAKGASLKDAVKRAKEFTTESIGSALRVGKGRVPVNPLAGIYRASEVGKIMSEVGKAAKLLISRKGFVKLIPEVGTNIAMLTPFAKSPEEVVGLSGRIVRVSGGAALTGFPELGGSKHVARAVLTAHQLNPEIKAGINIRFSEELLRRLRREGIPTFSFDRRREPRGVKTMEWGIREALRGVEEAPVVVFDRGAVGKEPMIRIFGRSASEVTNIVLQLLG